MTINYGRLYMYIILCFIVLIGLIYTLRCKEDNNEGENDDENVV